MDTQLDKLKKMTAWDTAPALTETEIGELLSAASVADTDGFAPSSTDWKAAYDLNSAAAAGWLIKAGRATELVEVDPPGSGLFTSKVFENCLEMAKIYSAKCKATIGIAR